MSKYWFYISTLILIQHTFKVGHAKVIRGSILSSCCDVEKTRATYKHEIAVMKVLKECDQELNETGDPRPDSKAVTITVCLAECIANKLKLLNEDNTLNEEAFRNHIVHEVATHDYQKAVANDVATICIDKVKLLSKGNPWDCSPISVILIDCVTREFFHACPIELQHQSKHCHDMRSWVARN